jgi:hypothetical protein
MLWTDEALIERMRSGWSGGLKEGTPCGGGSLLANTLGVRRRLPLLIPECGIESVCDAGAGDMHWAQDIFKGCDYRPFDLVPRLPLVQQWDISKHALPSCDLIICRLVLIHLDPPRIKRALKYFKSSARFLLASQYDGNHPFNPSRQFNRTNLVPLLGEPDERIPDINEDGASLALWDLR